MQRAVEALFTIFIGTAQVIFISLSVNYLLAADTALLLASATMAAVCGYFKMQRAAAVTIIEVDRECDCDAGFDFDLDDDWDDDMTIEQAPPKRIERPMLRLCHSESE